MATSVDLTLLPEFLQAGDYNAIDLRRAQGIGLREGVRDSASFAVSQDTGGNMRVSVATGFAAVQGDAATEQGIYVAESVSGATVLDVPTADVTNPRVDRVVLEVKDTAHDASGLSVARLRVVSGSPTAGATLANENGAAAVPASAVQLATVLVGAGSTAVVNANIGDKRPLGAVDGAKIGQRTIPQAAHGLGSIGALEHGQAPFCFLTHSVAQSIANATFAVLAFDTERSKLVDAGMHSTVTNNSRITIVTPGVYRFRGRILWAAHATAGTVRGLHLRKNGSASYPDAEYVSSIGGGVFTTTGGITADLPCVAGDYFELVAFQGSGGALNVSKQADWSPEFSAAFLFAA